MQNLIKKLGTILTLKQTLSPSEWVKYIKLDIKQLANLPEEMYTQFCDEEVKAIYRAYMLVNNEYLYATLGSSMCEFYKSHSKVLIFETILEMASRLGFSYCLTFWRYVDLKSCLDDVFPDGVPHEPFIWKHYIYLYPPLLKMIEGYNIPFHGNTVTAMENRLKEYLYKQSSEDS